MTMMIMTSKWLGVVFNVNWQMAINNYLNGIIETEVPYIGLRKGEVDRAVSIFDNMNKGGTPLSTFDLVAARAAQDRPRETSIVDQIIEALDEPIDVPTSIRNGLHQCS